MKWNTSETTMTSCRLDDWSSILAGAGINLFWTVSWTYTLRSTEVHLRIIYESESNLSPPSRLRLRVTSPPYVVVIYCWNILQFFFQYFVELCLDTVWSGTCLLQVMAWLFLRNRLDHGYNISFLQKSD